MRLTTPTTGLLKRRLGRTGLLVSEVAFGGAHVAAVDEGEEVLFRVFSLGVNFVETGRLYGESEYLIGRALRRLGEGAPPVYVASKTLKRSRDGALNELERSLAHLGLDSVDIYQLNDVDEESWAQVMSSGGALEGLQEAREQGLVRFIGLTSHSADVLRRAVESGQFDTIEVKYSPFNREGEAVIRLAHRREIGVIGMKPFGGFGMLGSLKAAPLAQILDPGTLLRYALSNRNLSVVIPGMRFVREVEENVTLAASYRPMTSVQKARVRQQAEALATVGAKAS
ncbi:MAG TPA: aldo/keto reductase [Dehalococcoidia bacterium]|nr:aldo/keto reductase [Dehalococcoidia bacterium]